MITLDEDILIRTLYVLKFFLSKSRDYIDINPQNIKTCVYGSLLYKNVYVIYANSKLLDDLQTCTFKNIFVCEHEDSMKQLQDSMEISLIRADIEPHMVNIILDIFNFNGSVPTIYLSFHHNIRLTEDHLDMFKKYRYVYYQMKLIEHKDISCILNLNPLGSLLFTQTPIDTAMISISFNVSQIPCYIITYNNLTYTANMVKQLERYTNNIIIVDNNSNYPKLLDYYDKEYNFHLIRLNENIGPYKFLYKHLSYMPDIFIYTDPDLLFNPNLPSDFINIMISLTEKYKLYKIGFALDLSDSDKFTDNKHDGKNIIEWETRFWINQVSNPEYELYSAPIDTTFAVYNKKYFIDNHFYPSIRIAGNFTCKHLPWYRNHEISFTPEEFIWYSKGNISSTWV